MKRGRARVLPPVLDRIDTAGNGPGPHKREDNSPEAVAVDSVILEVRHTASGRRPPPVLAHVGSLGRFVRRTRGACFCLLGGAATASERPAHRTRQHASKSEGVLPGENTGRDVRSDNSVTVTLTAGRDSARAGEAAAQQEMRVAGWRARRAFVALCERRSVGCSTPRQRERPTAYNVGDCGQPEERLQRRCREYKAYWAQCTFQ